MLPRSKKQKNDNEQIREDANALIQNAFDIQARKGSKKEFCVAVQQGLAHYQDLPNDERTIDDWVKITNAYLYIFNKLGNNRIFLRDQDLDGILNATVDEFNQLSALLAQDEFSYVLEDEGVKAARAFVQAHILCCVVDNGDPVRKLELYEMYCVPAQAVLLPEQGVSIADNIDMSYAAESRFMLGLFCKTMGQLDLAKRSFLYALTSISTLTNISKATRTLFLIYDVAASVVAPHMKAYSEHPLEFMKIIYNGTATYDAFAAICEKVLSTQDREPDLSRFFVQALGLVHKHLNLGILPDSNFQQHMQHDQFRAIFNDYRNRITARHMALQDMLLNHENVQVGLLGEVVGLRARVKQLEQQLDAKPESKVAEQGLFNNKKLPAKREREPVNPGQRLR